MGRSILVASGKGGTGRTTFAIAMATTLARRDQKVCLLDLNFGLRNLDIYMGLEDRVIFDIGDIMAGVCKVDKALIHDERFGELYLLESTQNKLIKGLTDGHIKALVAQLKKTFDYIVIDGPAAIDNDLTLAAAGADSAVVMVTPDPLAIRNTDAVDRRLKACGINSRCFVVNMVKPSLASNEHGPSVEDIVKTFEIPLAGIIPYDENVQIGNNIGTPVCFAADSYIARNVSEIVSRMLG